MPPAQKPTGAEDAESALTREQPVTAAAATPTPVNNESAGAEGAEFIAQDLSQDPPGNDDLLQYIHSTRRGSQKVYQYMFWWRKTKKKLSELYPWCHMGNGAAEPPALVAARRTV